MAYETTTVSTGIPFWDAMLSIGKASQQVLSAYAPRPGYAAQAGYTSRSDRGAVHQTTGNVEVIPVGEETLNVGTRLVAGETTRVRRIVVIACERRVRRAVNGTQAARGDAERRFQIPSG